VILALLFRAALRPASGKWVPVCLGLILGGAVGNLMDRLRFGSVVDFLDFRVWPVFNLADSCITVGAALLAVSFWRKG
jgi:signal peptidase II